MTVLMGLRNQLRLARLQVITDVASHADWPGFVASVFDNGVDLLEVRDATLGPDRLAEAFENARAIAFEHRKALVVGQDAALAARVGADFLHLGAADGPASAARTGLPQASLVGRSVHSDEQVRTALSAGGADYLVVGPVVGADGSTDAGLQLVRAAAAALPPADKQGTPWFAVGGVTPENLDAVLDAGARRIAVSGCVTRASDPGAVVAQLSKRLHQVWDADPALQAYRLSSFGTPGVASFKD